MTCGKLRAHYKIVSGYLYNAGRLNLAGGTGFTLRALPNGHERARATKTSSSSGAPVSASLTDADAIDYKRKGPQCCTSCDPELLFLFCFLILAIGLHFFSSL